MVLTNLRHNHKNENVMKLNNHRVFLILFTLMLTFSTGNLFAQDKDDDETVVEMEERERLKNDAQEAKDAFMTANPQLKTTLQDAVAYAIFPNVGKGAWVLGGAAGNGVVYKNGEVIGFTELRQVDIGFQFGGKAFRELIVFKTEDAFQSFKEEKFEFGGNASAVIWDKGKAKALTFENGAGVAIIPKAGAMVDISVGGQHFHYRGVK